jgi:hypothetical protein
VSRTAKKLDQLAVAVLRKEWDKAQRLAETWGEEA